MSWQVAQLIDGLHIVATVRFTTGSSLALSLWDTLVTLDDEVACVWSLPITSTKALFLFVRYGNLASLIYANHMFSGITNPTNDAQCKTFQAIYESLIVFNSFLYNAFIALRLYALWDRRKNMKIILCVALALVHIPVFVLGGQSIATFVKSTQYIPAPVNACTTLMKSNSVKIAFGCVLLYDVFVICLVVFNALDRPRGPQHKIVTDLQRDGAIWFFTLFGFRMCNFCFFLLLEPAKLYYVIFLTWGTISLTLTRMIIRMESLKRPFAVSDSRRFHVRTWVPARRTFELQEA